MRFAFWGAEEFGLLGSSTTSTSLTDAQLAKIYAEPELRHGRLAELRALRLRRRRLRRRPAPPGPPGSDADREASSPTTSTARAWRREPTAFDGRSDYGPFIAVGIPAGGLFTGAEGIKTAEEAAIYGGTAGVAYDPCYHQACDTINNLNTKALYELGDAAAHATLTLAHVQDRSVPRRQPPSGDRDQAVDCASREDRLALSHPHPGVPVSRRETGNGGPGVTTSETKLIKAAAGSPGSSATC